MDKQLLYFVLFLLGIVLLWFCIPSTDDNDNLKESYYNVSYPWYKYDYYPWRQYPRWYSYYNTPRWERYYHWFYNAPYYWRRKW
jgi:ABC-type dipeptide/oligopeptide/nickel transport system permease component